MSGGPPDTGGVCSGECSNLERTKVSEGTPWVASSAGWTGTISPLDNSLSPPPTETGS